MVWRFVFGLALCIFIAFDPLLVAQVSAAESPWLSPLDDDGVRLWMDASGKHIIEASLTSQSTGTATLKRIDGRSTTIGKDKLSVADRDYLASLEIGAVAFDAGKTSTLPSTVRQFLEVHVDRVTSSASARDIAGTAASIWKSVAIPAGDHEGETATALPLDRAGRLVMVTGDASESVSGSIVVDTQNNVAIASIDWPTRTRVLDYDPLSDTLLVGAGMTRAIGSAKDTFAFLIAVNGLRGFQLGGVGYVDAAFFMRPEDVFEGRSSSGKTNEMFCGGAIAGDRMLVHKFDRVVGVIVGKGTPMWAYPLENGKPIAISPDRRFLAASDTQIIGVVDIATGKMIRELETNDGEVRRSLAFAPDGASLPRRRRRGLKFGICLSRRGSLTHRIASSPARRGRPFRQYRECFLEIRPR